MALTNSNNKEIPEDAIILTERQALQFQTNLIKNWPKLSDVFILKYGSYFLGGAVIISGIFINNHFRRKFFLRDFGRFSTYLPICVIPSTASLLIHSEMVLKDVILMKREQCPLCLELRSAAIQSMLGAVFPLIVAPLGCASLAQRYATINLPLITEKPGEVYKIFKRMFKPIKTNIWYIFLSQAALGAVITHNEIKSIIRINLEIHETEKEDFS